MSTVIERLMRKVVAEHSPASDIIGPCFVWQGSAHSKGYAKISLGRRDDGMAYVHRVAYEATVGAVPAGKSLTHFCGNRLCCNASHMRLTNGGGPRVSDIPVIDRLMRFVVDQPCPNPHLVGDCWVFTGSTIKGYGHIGSTGKVVIAHRLAWEQRYGQVPDGLELDHLCRVRPCCNPDHLEPVTTYENIRRSRDRTWRAKLDAT